MSRLVPVCLLVLLLTAGALEAKGPPALPDADRVRIVEGFRLADALCDRIWPGWSKAPFAVLLVTPEHEFLIRHPPPAGGFTSLGEDAVLKQPVWFRKRVFPTAIQATFPAAGAMHTAVIGQAENTESRTSSRWVITLLHEHFHQLQYTRPRYYAGVDALRLSRGDQTGMWMLNYPFPYTRADVAARCATMGKALGEALRARGRPDFADRLGTFVKEKKRFRSLVTPERL
jgi:hypothetical protein